MDANASFGNWLTRRRVALGLTRVELARRVPCAAITLRKIEEDARRPSPELAASLASQLAIPAAECTTFVRVARGELRVAWLAPAEAPASGVVPTSPSIGHGSLPRPLTPLIGREADVAAVCALLRQSDMRLLTLTGPPGIGKTRLSLAVAAELHDAFADGVHIVPLAPLSDPALVITAIAQALGVVDSVGIALRDRLSTALRDRQLLLVLDNVEHLLAAAPELAALLADAPQLALLATSRIAMHLSGEQRYPVPPLQLPPADQDAASTARYAAVELFVQRARAVMPAFALSEVNAPAVAAICHRLDGLPLAIELAAARITLFSAQELLVRLEWRLALLTAGAADLPVRQQTLRGAIAWSYQLLSGSEQALFRRLGVFTGGYTLEAVECICAVAGEEAGAVIDDVSALVDQSLLQRSDGPDGAPRFIMLETIREYALERLEASGETEAVRRQHAHYFLALGEAKRPEESQQSPAQLAHLDSDYDNLWSALAWSQTSAGDPEVALGITGALRSLWRHRGLQREAIAALESALNHPHGVGRTVGHAIVRFALAQFLMDTGDYAAARIQSEQVLQLTREVGDTWWYAVALEHLGWLAREQGDSATAWARLTESLALFRELGYVYSIAETLNILAEVAILDEDPVRAEVLLTESRVLEQRENHDPNIIGWALNHLGHVAQLRGAYDRAAQLHHESLECFQAFGDQHIGFPWAYHSLGETALGLGHLDEAARYLAQGLTFSRTLSDQACMAWCVAGLGSVAAMDEQPERAARLWGAAEALRQKIGCRPAPAARSTYERVVVGVHAQLDEVTFAMAWTEGRTLPLEQAIAEALQVAE